MKTSHFIFAASLFIGSTLASCSSRVYDHTVAYTPAEKDSHTDIQITAPAEDKAPEYTWVRLTTPGCDYSILTDDLVASALRGKAASYPVIIEEAAEARGLYRLVNPMKAFLPSDDNDTEYNLIIDATDPDHVTIAKQNLGVDLGQGSISIESLASHYASQGDPRILIEDAGYYGKLSNGEITFPAAASFYLWADGRHESANLSGALRIVLPEHVAAVESTISKADYNLGTEYIAHSGRPVSIPSSVMTAGIDIDSYASR